MKKSCSLWLTLGLALCFLLCAAATSLADSGINAKDVFLKMPGSADLTKEYDGRQPAWVDFDYNINPAPTLWVNDQSKGEDGLGLVYLDIYRQNEQTGAYEEYDMGRYPGNMEGPGFNMDKAGFFNYGPNYGERYYSLKTVFPGQYKAVWLIPVYGTNTENFNEYEYVTYEAEFAITPPGIFKQVPELTRHANGQPAEAPEPAYDLSKATVKVDEAKVQAHEYWYLYDAEAENYAGEALAAAPADIGKYVYRLQVTDGAELDENVYAVFELTDPDFVEPFYRLLGDAIFDVPPTNPSKVYDGKPVTFDDMNIKYDVSRVGKSGATEWYEYIWYEPNRYGSFTNAIGELQGGKTGPTEPGTYNFQFGVHGDKDLEGFIYVKFTISPAEEKPAASFDDVNSGDWFHDAVYYATGKGLFTGTSGNSFSPRQTMTRAMMATVLYRMAGEPAATAVEISDVPAGEWYSDAVAWAVANDIMPAGDAGFGINDPVLREQIAYALHGMASLQELDTEATADMSAFSDYADIGEWAAAAMGWVVQAGIIEGKGSNNLDPQGAATRAEVATMLMRFMQLPPK